MLKSLKPFGIRFETIRGIGSAHRLSYEEFFGKEAKFTWKGQVALHFTNRFIREGHVNRAGIWVVSIKPGWRIYRATLKYHNRV